MAILTGNYVIEEFLKVWGIDIKNTTSVKIIIAVDDAVRVEVAKIVDIPNETELKEELKKYYLTEIKQAEK